VTPRNNENQPRRNEEREDIFRSFFVFFVSSWLNFRRSRSGRNERRYEIIEIDRIYKIY